MRLISRLKAVVTWALLPLCLLFLFNNCENAGVLEGSDESSVTSPNLAPVNLAPVIQPTDNMNLELGHRIQYQILADDDLEQSLSYSATGLPAGLSLDSESGMLSGMVRSIGNSTVTIEVSDGELSSTENFNVNVIANQGLVAITAKLAQQAPIIDGDLSEYIDSQQLVLTSPNGGVASYSILWDSQYIYFAGQIWDNDLNVQSLVGNTTIWRDDSIELMLDGLNNGGATRDTNDYKFFVNVANNNLINQGPGVAFNVMINSALDLFNMGSINQAPADSGYSIEIRVPWAGLPGVPVPQVGTIMGFEMSFNNRFADGTNSQTFWKNANAGGPNDPDGWGNLIFQ